MVCSWCLVQRGHYWWCCYSFLVIIPNLNAKSSWSVLLQVSAKANPATSSAIVSLDLNPFPKHINSNININIFLNLNQVLLHPTRSSPGSKKKLQIQKSDKDAGSDNRGAKSGLHSARKGVIAMMMLMLMVIMMIQKFDKDADYGVDIAHTSRE